jgi:hypothetical protein
MQMDSEIQKINVMDYLAEYLPCDDDVDKLGRRIE